MESVDKVGTGPGVESGGSYGVDIGDQAPDDIQRKRVLNQLPKAAMIVTLVIKQGRWADQTLFAFGVSRVKQMSLCHQHEPRRLGASQHHTRTSKYMRLKNLPIPKKTNKPRTSQHQPTLANKTFKTKQKTATFSVWRRRTNQGLENRAEGFLQYKASLKNQEGA